MKKVIVRLENFCKSYENKEVIKDINLEVYEGEFLTLLGSSGCGKTTILRAISGLDPVTSGKIYINDVDVTNLDPQEREVNTIFQNYALFPLMTIEDNIGFGLKMKKVPKEEIKKAVKEMMELVHLEGYEKRFPSELSGGEQQRVSIVRGLINNPKVLLLDEPLSNLDAKLRVQMRTEIAKLHERLGATMIYVTHDQTEAMTLGTKIVVMKDGIIQQVDTPQNLYNYPQNLFVAGFIGSPQMNFIDVAVAKEDGKVVTVTIDGTEGMFECDSVIIAVSQSPRKNIVANTTGIETNKWGLVLTDDKGHTTREGVFASGDVVTGANTVVHAAAYAKVVAESIEEYCKKD